MGGVHCSSFVGMQDLSPQRTIKDRQKVGMVYAVMYSARAEASPRKYAQPSVLVDLYGESTVDELAGYEFTTALGASPDVHDVTLLGGFVSTPKRPGIPIAHNPDLQTLKWMQVGKLELPSLETNWFAGQPRTLMYALEEFSLGIFKSLTLNRKAWSDSVNSHQFSSQFFNKLLDDGPATYPFTPTVERATLQEWFRSFEPFTLEAAQKSITRKNYLLPGQ